jgi:P27 family predicted phage terminase small subunit
MPKPTGPKPRPKALRLLRGEPASQINFAEPVAPTGNIEPPAWLTGAAADKWRELAPMLASMGVLADPDRDLLGRYCCVFERWLVAMEACRKGLDVLHHRDENGRVYSSQVSPYGTLMRRLGDQMTSIATEFGMSPSSRSRLTGSTAAAKPVDPLDAWLSKYETPSPKREVS